MLHVSVTQEVITNTTPKPKTQNIADEVADGSDSADSGSDSDSATDDEEVIYIFSMNSYFY
jgi:hypothetical protein